MAAWEWCAAGCAGLMLLATLAIVTARLFGWIDRYDPFEDMRDDDITR